MSKKKNASEANNAETIEEVTTAAEAAEEETKAQKHRKQSLKLKPKRKQQLRMPRRMPNVLYAAIVTSVYLIRIVRNSLMRTATRISSLS